MKNRSTVRVASSLVGVSALALGATAVLVNSSAHAASAELGYSCTIPILGAKTFKVTLDTDAGATMAKGSVIKNLSVKVVPDPAALKLAYQFGARQFEGETTFTVLVGGASYNVKATTPRSSIAADGSVPPTNATLPLNAPLTTAGNVVVTAGKIQIEQKVYDGNGDPFSMSPSASIPCTPPAGDLTVDAVSVTGGTAPTPQPPTVKPKAKTVTGLKARAGKKRLAVKVSVKNVASGKVQLKLAGPKRVTRNVAIKRGKGSVTIKKLRPGRYKLTATYRGSATTLPSKKTISVRVRK